MADIFMNYNAKLLLREKFILILGDSNSRALYRDIIWLLNNNSIIPKSHLRRKLDFTYLGDRLLKQGELNRGRDYVEMREYLKDNFNIKFNFLTKCLTKEVEILMEDYKGKKCKAPDVVLVNSCLWDITRWGPNGVNLYKENLHKLFKLLKNSLPSNTLVIFSTTLPVSPYCKGAFLVKQVEFMKQSLRFEVMEANLFARQLVPTYGYNILDFHYHFRMQIHRREKDGVHWVPLAVRHMTNLFLTHLSLSWGKPLPGNFNGNLLERMKVNVSNSQEYIAKIELPKSSVVHETIMPPPKVTYPHKGRRKKCKKQVPTQKTIRKQLLDVPLNAYCGNNSMVINNINKSGEVLSFMHRYSNANSQLYQHYINPSINLIAPAYGQPYQNFVNPAINLIAPVYGNSSTVFYEDNFTPDYDFNNVCYKTKYNHHYTSRQKPY